MSKVKDLYTEICFYIDDYYDDDEIAILLGISESMVRDARRMHEEE